MPRQRKVTDAIRLQSTNRFIEQQPDWSPLLALVGTELAGWFSWMCVIELSDGALVHVFRHDETRAWVHIAADGRTFLYDSDGAPTDTEPDYVEVPRNSMLLTAFRGWSAKRFDEPATERALDRAHDFAERAMHLPVDRNELRQQSEFEAGPWQAA